MEADERDNRVGEGDGDRKPKKRVDRRRNTAMVGAAPKRSSPKTVRRSLSRPRGQRKCQERITNTLRAGAMRIRHD